MNDVIIVSISRASVLPRKRIEMTETTVFSLSAAAGATLARHADARARARFARAHTAAQAFSYR